MCALHESPTPDQRVRRNDLGDDRMNRRGDMLRGIATAALAIVPERFARRLTLRLLVRLPDAWGMGSSDKRLDAVRASYSRAFPDRDASRFVEDWTRRRAEGMAASVVALCRGRRGRPVRGVNPVQPPESPCGAIIVAPHTCIDPLPQLSVIVGATQRVLWVVFPIANSGDERSLWLVGPAPDAIDRAMVPVDDPHWMLRAVHLLRQGGIVMIALDSPFVGARQSAYHVPVGAVELSVPPSLEVLVHATGADLYLSTTRSTPRGTWTVDLLNCADLPDLVTRARAWIEAFPLDWAGWPFLTQRVSIFRLRHAAAGLPNSRELFPVGERPMREASSRSGSVPNPGSLGS
jgi:hypothetical protein